MSFDAEKIRDEIVQWIRDWFEENGKGCKAVVGLSGGKDSSVVAALCVEALGKENVFGDDAKRGAVRYRCVPQACGASSDRKHRGQYKGCI